MEVMVFFDWENFGMGEIMFFVVWYCVEGMVVGLLLINFGGFGLSGVDFVLNSFDFVVGFDFIENFDVIGFDFCGVGVLMVVICYDVFEMDEYFYGIFVVVCGSVEWEVELFDVYKGFVEVCEVNSDGILLYIMMINVVCDMDLICVLLGDE